MWHLLLDGPLDLFGTLVFFKKTNKHTRSYFSTSSLVAYATEDLLLLFDDQPDRYGGKIWLPLTSCSSAYDRFQKLGQLARGEREIILSVDVCCIGISGKTASSARPLYAHY